MVELRERLHGMSLAEARGFYARMMRVADLELMRWMCRNDRFFLLSCVLGMDHMNNEWCYARCREVESEPDGCLDLWSRGHYKSTIITLGGTVQEVLRDPEITVCIMSFNKQTADKFVNQIKGAFENAVLVELFPDILWPKRPKENWSVMKGLWVQREGLGKEPTVMGSGLVDGMPTGMHYKLRVYDDVVTPESVTTPEQITKTTAAYELSNNLGTGDGERAWLVGTRYHTMDTYRTIMDKGLVKERRRVGIDEDGEPLLYTRETWEAKRVEMGRHYSAQMLQDPLGDGVAYFRGEWLEYWDRAPDAGKLSVYFLIDSANSKKKGRDYTVMWVLGLGMDRNYYILDVVRDKLDLVERTRVLMELHRRWRPLMVYWEQVGAMSDVQHVRDIQERELYRFPIVEVKQSIDKRDRVAWLIPLFSERRVILPRRKLVTTEGGDVRDVVADFVREEYMTYPVVTHDDMLDALANVKHPDVEGRLRWPEYKDPMQEQRERSRAAEMWRRRV